MVKIFWEFFGAYKEVHQVADIYTTQASKYIFKIAPSKNAFLKIVFSENINIISLIYSSSESSEELSK